MVIEFFKDKQAPHPFYSRNAARLAVPEIYESTLSIGKAELEKLVEINEMLQDARVDSLVDEGKLTLGIIKPKAYMGKGMPADDDAAAEVLFDEIGRDNVLFVFSTQLTQPQIDAIYAGVKQKYQYVYDSPGDTLTIWEALNGLLNSGPVTFILLYRQEGDAVTWWREKMGKTHPTEADPDSIRGKYGLEEIMPNNLTHGSDSVEGAKREISVLKQVVSELTERCTAVSKSFPSEDTLRQLGILESNDEVLEVARIYDSGMRSESWIYGYQITYVDSFGERKVKFIKEKHLISMGGALQQRAIKQLKNFVTLGIKGIPTPKTYAAYRAALYQDFIVNENSQEIFERLRQTTELSDEDKNSLDQLTDIAARLDHAGAPTLSFTGDLLYDADRGQFLYIDAGYDLGEMGGESVSNALDTLMQLFRNHKDYKEQKYFEVYISL